MCKYFLNCSNCVCLCREALLGLQIILMMMKRMMKMKIKRKHYLCQRKQSLSHHNGNCGRTLLVGGRIFFPKTKQNHSKAAIFCELLCVTQINLYKWISANQVPIQRSRRRGNTSFRGKTYAFELSSLDHTLPFSQGRKWKTKQKQKKPTGQEFCQWNSALAGQLLQSEYAFLDHV